MSTKPRQLRKNLTDAERFLWKELRLRQIGGFKFRRQQPIDPYIVDFICFEKRLIIEVDGGQHSEKTSHDFQHDEWLKGQGFRILRFWNSQVLNEIEAVREAIHKALLRDTPHLTPPPQGGRRC